MDKWIGIIGAAFLLGCSSSESPIPNNGGTTTGSSSSSSSGGGIDAGSDAMPDAEPTCAPLTVVDFAPPTPGTFAALPGAHCVRDIDCEKGSFCLVVNEVCEATKSLEGPGLGGHTQSGGACSAAPAFASTCDSLALEWSQPLAVSKSASSLGESDSSLVADGHGNVLVAWAANTAGARQQFNGLAMSTDDGKTFAPAPAPIDVPTDAENDAFLTVDGNGTFYYVWEGYANNFKGAQHVWSSHSKDGKTWSAALQIDTMGDDGNGTIPLDFPYVAVNPVNQKLYYTYQITASAGPTPMKIVIGAAGGDTVQPSVELDDGTRPGAYRDLANGVFDSKGNYYAAWIELAGSGGSTGMGLQSGDKGNAVYFTRLDTGPNDTVIPLGHDVLASTKGQALLFGIPQVLVTPDGSTVFALYAVGTKNAIDVYVAASQDRGATWGAAIKVNDDATCATHYDASAVLDAKGRLWVLWYDNRDGNGHLVYSVSDDGAKTFHPNHLVTPNAFPFETFQYSVGWLGDYFQVTTSGDQIYAAWADPHDNDQSHINFAKATLP